MKKLALLITASLLSAPVLAEKVAITGGKIFTLAEQGTLDSGTVLMTDGRIDRVITGTEVPQGYRVIDASGKVVTPGLVGSMTSLGLVEVSSSAGVVDSSVESTPITRTGAALDVSYAVNPDSSLLGVTRIEGMTSAATSVTYTDNLFYGQGAVITLSGDAPVLKPRAFMVVNVGESGANDTGGTRAALWVTLENALAEAAAADSDLSPTQDWHGLNTRADVKALKAVLSGDMPLIMEADRAADIRQVIAFKKRHNNINVVLMHGVEAWRVASELADADIPVILDPEYNLPGGFDQMGATLANAARLEAAGVTVAVGMDTHNIRLATQHAGNAVANGLSYEGGLASLTSAPAAILGIDDQLGSLAPGKRADVVIWSGDPLEVTQVAEQVFINGEAIEMRSRQTRLRDRYLAVQEEQARRPTHYVRPD
ncbi:amidohydrolase family protein [Alteromonas sp. ASW11-19]|uniref:Amidohydrolase family protein n=1 Tax=Alteromonas salexigens TaxID=2982530 RepID=A0ABT2VPM7_9ALTE|nr:amidohydrolase family protein [Alteromonas salexigens]MCU7555276.1 amidohydrolase family protein [Alteromonas salexigens]